MALSQDRCIALRKVEYSETSQILVLFAREHGLLRVIAKGAHRRTKAGSSKFDGGIDLLDLGNAVFTFAPERELNLLTEWSLTDGHLNLRRSLRGMYLGQYAAELTSLLFEEHDAHPAHFDRLEHLIADLATPRAEEAFLAFQLDLLRESGYMPELAGCGECGLAVGDGRDAASYFSPTRGGIVCRNCEGAVPDRVEVDVRLVRLIQSVLRLPRTNGNALPRLPRLTRDQTDPLNRLFATHIEHTLGKKLRLPRYVL